MPLRCGSGARPASSASSLHRASWRAITAGQASKLLGAVARAPRHRFAERRLVDEPLPDATSARMSTTPD
ncbi:hypothetical protein WME91_50205 [Sorangium sp. So ce269]